MDEAESFFKNHSGQWVEGSEIPGEILSAEANPLAQKGRFETQAEFNERISPLLKGKSILGVVRQAKDYAYIDGDQIYFPININRLEVTSERKERIIEGQNSYGATCSQKIVSSKIHSAKFRSRNYREKIGRSDRGRSTSASLNRT